MSKIISTLLILAALAWAGLYLSGKAVLVKQTEGGTQAAGLLATTTCTYFDGLGLHDLEHAYSPIAPLNNLAGGSGPNCARLIDTTEGAY